MDRYATVAAEKVNAIGEFSTTMDRMRLSGRQVEECVYEHLLLPIVRHHSRLGCTPPAGPGPAARCTGQQSGPSSPAYSSAGESL